MIDPVDGTTNFVCGFPYTAVCIGIMHHKQPIIGIVNNPIMNELYYARVNQGATCNGKSIESKTTSQLKTAVINTEFGSSRETGRIQTVVDNMKAVVLAPARLVFSSFIQLNATAIGPCQDCSMILHCQSCPNRQ